MKKPANWKCQWTQTKKAPTEASSLRKGTDKQGIKILGNYQSTTVTRRQVKVWYTHTIVNKCQARNSLDFCPHSSVTKYSNNQDWGDIREGLSSPPANEKLS